MIISRKPVWSTVKPTLRPVPIWCSASVATMVLHEFFDDMEIVTVPGEEEAGGMNLKRDQYAGHPAT